MLASSLLFCDMHESNEGGQGVLSVASASVVLSSAGVPVADGRACGLGLTGGGICGD